MVSELETAIKNVTAKVAEYVENIATLTVETRYVPIEEDATPGTFAEAKPAARTIIRFDSDSETIIPMRKGKDQQLEVDGELFNIHQTNVTTAIAYRAQMLQMLLDILRIRPRS